MKNRVKRCKACREEFLPNNTLQKACSVPCAINLVDKTKQKASLEKARIERADLRKRREKLKSKGDWAKEAQIAFNAYIRERDYDKPCISCGRHHTGQYDAGHYRTTAAASQLRFNTYNVHKQCSPCNRQLSGNILPYRSALLALYGWRIVEAIETNNDTANHTVDYYKRVKRIFGAKARRLKKRRLNG